MLEFASCTSRVPTESRLSKAESCGPSENIAVWLIPVRVRQLRLHYLLNNSRRFNSDCQPVRRVQEESSIKGRWITLTGRA